ncbi:MAG: hypothetical protein IPL46_20005 [Saprospiraceae bacterium]|nr:hypothetical protein [Saprospiraceae bacterium]
MKKRIDLIILFILASVMLSPLAAQELPFRHFTSENEINPLPGTSVTAVFQDQTGYIWFAVCGIGPGTL